uniref:Rubisco LSMT substrate-binding domain-containing protein n=1 Tax=Prasinoderma coloniale TaxID=156133 RepID=A0A7R9T8R0_9VIRI
MEHPKLAGAAEEAFAGSEIVGMTAWVLATRAGGEGEGGPAAALADAVRGRGQHNPLLWPEEEAQRLLRGTSVLPQLPARRAEVALAYERIATHESIDARALGLTYDAFAAAFCDVLASAVYLPSAECFALVPTVSTVMAHGDCGGGGANGGGVGSDRRRVAEGGGGSRGVLVDYDLESECVVVVAEREYAAGDEPRLPWGEGRNSADLALTFGELDAEGKARDDFLTFQFGMVQNDSLYTVKAGVLAELGYATDGQEFPVFEDRFPTQLLNYLRLSRVTDIGLLAKLSMETDNILSQINEYEILQLLMGDVRERLEEFENTDTVGEQQTLRDAELNGREELATLLRLGEKRVLQGTMTGVRTRLAPIRGVPTKGGGMQDPNADLAEMFESFEQLPKRIATGKIFDGLFED